MSEPPRLDVSDLEPRDVMSYRAGFYFGTLQRIAQVLGPTAPPCCPGCQSEIAEVLRLLRAAGVEYQPRKAKP